MDIATTKHHRTHPEQRAASDKARHAAHPERKAVSRKKWADANRPYHAFYAMGRIACRIQRTPAWADLDAIRLVYERASVAGLHVDHVLPLRGKTVSGLHVHNNLQLLTKSENSRKGNRLQEEPRL